MENLGKHLVVDSVCLWELRMLDLTRTSEIMLYDHLLIHSFKQSVWDICQEEGMTEV